MTTDTDPIPWNDVVLDQLEHHWHSQLRPRLDGLTDEEYFWEPTATTWGVHPRGTSTAPVAAGTGSHTVDFAFPPPDPPPATTIGWRLAHLVVGVLAMRNHAHFGGPAADYESWAWPRSRWRGSCCTSIAS